MILIAIMALRHPSMNALAYFWIYLIMFHPMTMHVMKRFKWGMIYLIILFAIEFVWFIFKIVQVKHFKDAPLPAAESEKYWKLVKKLLMLGYKFKFDKDIYKIHDKNMTFPNKEKWEISDLDKFASFDIEIVAFVGNIVLFCFCYYHNYKVNKLYNMGVNKIELYIRLIDPPEDENDEDELPKDSLGVDRSDKRMVEKNRRERKRMKEE